MEPRSPSVLDEPEPEEPVEATDYYEAMRMGWLSAGAVEEIGPDSPAPEPPGEQVADG